MASSINTLHMAEKRAKAKPELVASDKQLSSHKVLEIIENFIMPFEGMISDPKEVIGTILETIDQWKRSHVHQKGDKAKLFERIMCS